EATRPARHQPDQLTPPRRNPRRDASKRYTSALGHRRTFEPLHQPDKTRDLLANGRFLACQQDEPGVAAGNPPLTADPVEVLHVVGVEGPSPSCRKREVDVIALAAHSGLVHREAIESPQPQSVDNSPGVDVLVEIQPQHYGWKFSGVMPSGCRAANSAPNRSSSSNSASIRSLSAK